MNYSNSSASMAPIVIGFRPSTTGTSSPAESSAMSEHTTLQTPLLSRGGSGRTAGSSPGLLSLQLSLHHDSKQGFEDYYDSEDDEDNSDSEMDHHNHLEASAREGSHEPYAGGAGTDKPIKRSQSQPISIPTTLWIKDPAASAACCFLQRERAIRRQQYEQSEAYARQQQEFQQYQLQQLQLQQQRQSYIAMHMANTRGMTHFL